MVDIMKWMICWLIVSMKGGEGEISKSAQVLLDSLFSHFSPLSIRSAPLFAHCIETNELCEMNLSWRSWSPRSFTSSHGHRAQSRAARYSGAKSEKDELNWDGKGDNEEPKRKIDKKTWIKKGRGFIFEVVRS